MFGRKKTEAFTLRPDQQLVLDKATNSALAELERFILLRAEPLFARSLVRFYDEFESQYTDGAALATIHGLVSGYELALTDAVEDLFVESAKDMPAYWEFADLLDKTGEMEILLRKRLDDTKETARSRALGAFGEYLKVFHPDTYDRTLRAASE